VVSVALVGNVNVDLLSWPVAELPPPGTERPIERVDVRVGGAAAVTGSALARLGVESIVIGCVGRDTFGDLALEELRRHGVDTSRIARLADAATGVSIAFEAPGRERSFAIALGSLARFEPTMVPPEALGAAFLLLCGYFNHPAMRGRAAAGVLAAARANGATTMLDTGWDHDGWPTTTRREVLDLLPLVDVFLPNEAEAASLSGEADPVAAARALAAVSGGWVVVKTGADGAVAAGPDGRTVRADAPVVRVVDTTGAGDAFNAGVIAARIGGAEIWDAVRLGVAVASAVVSRPSHDRYPAASELARPSTTED
jgi:sugar/nucleoside kinase (ribokinase family)